MIYEALKDRLLDLLKAPRHPPEPPVGSPGAVEVFRADPRFLALQMIVWGLGFLAALVAEVAFLVFGLEDHWEIPGYLLIVLTLIASAIQYLLIRLDYDLRYYVVTDRSLRIREGALIVHEATFTYANVQNLRILQGPLERLMGIANLQLETAGGSGGSGGERPSQLEMAFGKGHQGILRGVANAREVRDRIMVLLKRYRDAGLGDPEDRHRVAPAAAAPGGLPPVAMKRLGEIRDELRRLARGGADEAEPA